MGRPTRRAIYSHGSVSSFVALRRPIPFFDLYHGCFVYSRSGTYHRKTCALVRAERKIVCIHFSGGWEYLLHVLPLINPQCLLVGDFGKEVIVQCRYVVVLASLDRFFGIQYLGIKCCPKSVFSIKQRGNFFSNC